VKCPLCRDTDLEPRFAQGTEVDVCPRCRGLWLDRGELERLLATDAEPAAVSRPDRDRDPRDDRDRRPSKPRKSRSKRLADLLDDVLDL
jgi:Zn-finger nucleic acid-binding protein